jgi:hypothetical protein
MVVASVCASIVALVVCSVPVFGTRFLNDMDFYALVADKLLAGHTLYREALDTKPPLVFVHYALVFKLFGQNNATAIKLVTMVWLGLSATMMVALRRALGPATTTSFFAAPVFVLASFSGWGEDFLSSNTEVLANLFILLGVWFLASMDFRYRPWHVLAGGICIGVACLYRYQSGAALAAYGLTMLARRRQFDRKLARALLAGTGMLLPSAITIAYYANAGALADLHLMLSLQLHYARDADSFHWPTLLGRAALAVIGLLPLLVLALRQAVEIVRRGAAASRTEIFELMFTLCSVSTFLAGNRLFPHYLVQAIPGFALLASARLQAIRDRCDNRPSWIHSHPFAPLVGAAAIFAVINGTYYWTRKDSTVSPDLAAFVRTHSRPSDEVLLWTWRPNLLVETGRAFATRLLVNSPLIGQLEQPRKPGAPPTRRPGLPGLWPVFLRDLSTSPPRLLVDDPPGRSPWSLDRLAQLRPLLAQYRPCQVIDDVCVYLRSD